MANELLSTVLRLLKSSRKPDQADGRRARQSTITTPALDKANSTASFNDLTIEVLQHIFSYLDLFTLLKLRCVCMLWNNCIPGDSPELQEAMFLPAKATLKATERPPFTLCFEIYTDANCRVHRFSSTRAVKICKVNTVVLSHMTKSSVALHPFLSHIDRYLVPAVPSLGVLSKDSRTPRSFHFIHLRNKTGELLQPEHLGALSDMLVSMRPVTELHIDFCYMDCDFDEIITRRNIRQCILSNREGVQLVDVFRVIEQQIMGLLRDETLRQIQELSFASRDVKELREKLLYTVCPVKGKMTFLRC